MFLSKGAVFINAATCRLESCNLVRKELAKISCRKCSEILKRAILWNPCRKPSVEESVFNKIKGIGSRPETSLQEASIKEVNYDLLLQN